MKQLITGLLVLFSYSGAYASTVVCDGHELIPSGGKDGVITFDLESYGVRWRPAGESQDIVLFGDGAFCGATVESTKCTITDRSGSRAPGFGIQCEQPIGEGPNEISVSAYLISSEVTKNGRFECRPANVKNRMLIEFRNCTGL